MKIEADDGPTLIFGLAHGHDEDGKFAPQSV
jgi:hypothetical protein